MLNIIHMPASYIWFIVGWYHSHPHITVLPSHVDIATQFSYQQYMDPHFVGIIFSVFNSDPSHKGRVQVIAFQSIEIPVASDVPAPSPAPVPSSSSGSSGKGPGKNLTNLGAGSSPIIIDEDSNDGSMKKSSGTLLPPSQTRLERIEIPFSVEGAGHAPVPNTLEAIVRMQAVMLKEEQAAFHEANNAHPTSSHPLTFMYNSAVYQKSICRLLEYGCSPMLATLQDMLASNLDEIQQLKEMIRIRTPK
eukprot:TRINITY_DN8853_c0_g1_i2.p1 TRINITY_DN8853_c0_g1~~TRINITY_DN8853_c0_g1_i2.p1  ORF type:complete len:248 (+),score=59.72 TRINITY_DN8853_c0_g1_i2:140-883(+)